MASGDALPIPRKNVAYRVSFPILDADGDLVTGATALDSEISKDGGTFTDVTAEATEIATSSGMYYLDLTATEMDANTVVLIIKTTTSGAKTTPIVLYPEEAGDIRVNLTEWLGTAPLALSNQEVRSAELDLQGMLGIEAASVDDPSATTTQFITDLIRTEDDSYVGGILRFTSGTPSNSHVRTIVDYDGATKKITVAPALPTAPADATAFRIMIGPTTFMDGGLRAASMEADAITTIADAVLSRPISNVEPADFRTLYGAIASLVNRSRINNLNQLEIYKVDDSTILVTIPGTVDSALLPIRELNPP